MGTGGGRRRAGSRPTVEQKEETKEDCKFCGAPNSDKEMSDTGSQGSIGQQFLCYQSAARKNLEMGEHVVNGIRNREANLTTLQSQVDQMKADLEAERKVVDAFRKTLEEKELALNSQYLEYTSDQQQREKLLVQREHSAENMMASLRSKESHVKEIHQDVEARLTAVELRETMAREACESRERLLLEKESKIQMMERDWLSKQKDLTNLSSRLTNREELLFEKEEASIKEMADREVVLKARETQARQRLNDAEEKSKTVSVMETDLLAKQKAFHELEAASIKELEVRESGLCKRELNVGEAQSEVKAKSLELGNLREEFRKRVDQFEQLERVSKFDLAKREEVLDGKEADFLQRIEVFGEKEKDLNSSIADFQKRESDFELLKETTMQDLERRETAANDRERALKKSEGVLEAKEREVHTSLLDVKKREETMNKERTVWKLDMERRERIIVSKEEKVVHLSQATSEMDASVKESEKELDKRKMLLANEEREMKQKFQYERMEIDQLRISIKETEDSFSLQRKELQDWDMDLSLRERDLAKRKVDDRKELKRREEEASSKEVYWKQIEEECSMKLQVLEDREEDLIRREQDYLKSEMMQSEALSRRKAAVSEKEAKYSNFETVISRRETIVTEKETLIATMEMELEENEKAMHLAMQRREEALTVRERDFRENDAQLKAKLNSFELLEKDLLQRDDEFNAHKQKRVQDLRRQFEDVQDLQKDLEVRMAEFKKQEEANAKKYKDLEARYEEVEHLEVKYEGIYEREMRVEEYERVVMRKDKEVSNCEATLSNREESVKLMEDRFQAQLVDLASREAKIVDEEEELTGEIEKRRVALQQLKEKIKVAEEKYSSLKVDLDSREREIIQKETYLKTHESSVMEDQQRLKTWEAMLMNRESAMQSKDADLKMFERDVVEREDAYAKKEMMLNADLVKREKHILVTERDFSRREAELRSLEIRLKEEGQQIENQRTRMVTLQEKMQQRELKIQELDRQIKKRESYLKEARKTLIEHEGDLIRRAQYICQRRVSDSFIEDADPPSDPNPSDPPGELSFMEITETRSLIKRENVSDLDISPEPALERGVAPQQFTPSRVDTGSVEIGDSEIRSWYGRMRSMLFGWRNTPSGQLQQEDLERVEQEIGRRGEELEQRELFVRARETAMNKRFEEEGYPPSSSRKRSSQSTGNNTLADTPDTNVTVKIHRSPDGQGGEKSYGRWRRQYGGGLRVLRSSVEGAEQEASPEGVPIVVGEDPSGDWEGWNTRLRKAQRVQTTQYPRSTKTTAPKTSQEKDEQSKQPEEDTMTVD